VDGLLILDLPPEEAEEYGRWMDRADLCPIFLVAPTTPEERIATIVGRARGFVYYVSREGVTGMQSQVAANLSEMTARLRRCTALPVAVGFGVSNAEQARQVAAHAEAVVVGSAVVNQIARFGQASDLVATLGSWVQDLSLAVKESVSDGKAP
jgi:tryptophan synthase alpha chain